MASSTESNGSYKHMQSPPGAHAIRMDFSNHMETVTASQKELLTGSTGSQEKTLYDHDLVMIFPRREGGELKKPEDFTIDAFVSLLTGKDRHRSKRHGKIMIDPFARVLRTKRCFLDDLGHDLIGDDEDNDHSDKAEQRRLTTEERILEGEYEKLIGSRQPTTEVLFCELVAMTIARRVQLACGLTTRMFRSCDDDEIIMTIKADDNDLRVEADRTNYRLQVSNKPFDMWAHADKNNIVRQEIGDAEWRKSIEHLRQIRGSPQEDSEFPEMDPLLISRGDEFHPKLSHSLKVWGHTEEADGQFAVDESARTYKGGIMERFWTSLFGMAYDPTTYFSAFADYRIEEQYQPYYRRYPIQWGGKREETLFTQKDRIRLASGIVTRHINTDALVVSEYLTGDMFALHDEIALKELRSTWALRWLMLNQPLNKIRFYFGEKIALYFAWLGFYTKMLIFPSIAGIITYAVIETQDIQKGEDQGYILIGFAVFVVIWSSVFAEVWKRKNGLFNSLWGLHGFHRSFRYRAQFRGTKSYNPITDAEEMTYESKTKRRRAFLISIVVVLMMVGIVCVALFALFLLKHIINEQDKVDAKYQSSLTMGVTGLNAVQILILNTVYRGVAKKLNDLENHRTDREYENYLVIKVFLFQFCNSFASFFYIAFVKRTAEGQCLHEDDCMSELRDQLLILFLIRIIVGNTLEVVVPYLKYQYQLYLERSSGEEKVSHNYIEDQAKLMPYEHNEAFEDYNEMVIQYGFITLFVVAFPLTPLLALANNIAEVHVDSVKLCYVHRRPFPHPAKSIGAWFYILRFMSYIALGTNCALILWTSPLFENSSMSGSTKAFVFVVSCQVCLMLAVFIERAIPDIPQQLKLLMQRHDHIVATVFKGMDEGDDSKLYETAEVVDLTIHPNNLWEDKNSLEEEEREQKDFVSQVACPWREEEQREVVVSTSKQQQQVKGSLRRRRRTRRKEQEMMATEAHLAPPQRPRGARVERKGRFTITEITPSSPHETSAFRQDDGGTQLLFDNDAGADGAAAGETAALNQAFAETLVVVEQEQQQVQTEVYSNQQQVEVSSPQMIATTSTPVTPMLQPQSPEEEDVVMPGKAALAVAVAVLQPSSHVDASSEVIDSVAEPEPAPPVATVEVYELQQQHHQQQQQPIPVPVDHVFIEYDAVDSDSDTPAQPKAPAEVPQQHSPEPLAKPNLTIDISNGTDSAVAMDVAASGNNGAVHSPSQQQESPSSPTERRRDRTSSRHEEIQSVAERRAMRKSRFTITDLDSPRSRENSDELFGHSYSTMSAYSTDFSQSQVASSEFSSSSTALPTDVDGQQQHSYDQQLQQQQQTQQQEELDMQRLTRSMTTMGESQLRESQRLKARSISPIRPALEMNDLANEASTSNDNGNGNGVFLEDQLDQHQQEQEQDSDYLSRHRTYSTTALTGYESETSGAIPYFAGSTSSTGFLTPVSATTPSNSGGGARRGMFSAGNGGSGSNGRRQTATYYQANGFGNGNGSGGSGGRRSSRQKSITISAAQFLQQQQTIAALIRQQQELKHIIGVLQEQQQQLMSVPVQLHELRLENAKGDGKDEMMVRSFLAQRELYVQVDSLMRANDSLQVLVTQAEKETQDRAQETEFLTEENDQLRARCDYFERKYIEEHKLMFMLEEEVQRFRMMSLTHELEQRNSVSQDGSSSSFLPPPVPLSALNQHDD